jgi:hypothetical protein
VKDSSWRQRFSLAAFMATAGPSRKLLSLISLAATFAISFALVSYAQGSGRDVSLPADLPVAALPPVALSDEAKVALNNAIGGYQAARFGITQESLGQTREFPVAGSEVMDVVPGTNGVCIAFRGGSACGNPGSDGHILGLYLTNSDTGVTGAGITDKSVRRVALALGGSTLVLPVRRGIFVLPAAAGLRQPQDRAVPLQASAG